jgi:hypothetical protein
MCGPPHLFVVGVGGVQWASLPKQTVCGSFRFYDANISHMPNDNGKHGSLGFWHSHANDFVMASFQIVAKYTLTVLSMSIKVVSIEILGSIIFR